MAYAEVKQWTVMPLRSRILWCLIAILSCSDSSYSQVASSKEDIAKLSQFIELAVTTHPSVQAKQAELAGSIAGVDAAKWQYYPSLSAQTERNTSQSNNPASIANTSSIRLQQTLWAGGKLDAGRESAEFRKQSAQNALLETRNAVALRTLEAWQSWETALRREQVLRRLIEQLERLSGMMERRVEQQISPPVELQQIKIRVSQAKADLLTAKSNQDIARQRLMQWIGSDGLRLMAQPANTQDVSSPAASLQQNMITQWPPETAQKLDLAAQRSPSMMRSENDIQATQSDVKQKRAEQWPTVYARAERQFNSGGSLSQRGESKVSFGLQYTLGSGLSLYSQIESAQSKVSALQNEREAQLRQILETYRSEWRDYQTTAERISLALEVSNSNTALIDSYTRLFVAGRRSWLELLNALREANGADQLLSDLLIQQQASHVRLSVYLGELSWQSRPVP
jgi:outer membrane protein, adhesin transport system